MTKQDIDLLDKMRKDAETAYNQMQEALEKNNKGVE